MKSRLGSLLDSRFASDSYELATARARNNRRDARELARSTCTRRRAWTHAIALLALVTMFVSSGCHTTHEAPMPAPRSETTASEPLDVAPPWLTQPLSEEKLHSIETWLVTEGPHSSALWRTEGELVLNLGRLEFARRAAADKATANTATNASDLRTARAGLERVMGDIDATSAQRRRAQDGMARADKLLAQSSPATRSFGTPVIARATWGAAQARADRMERNKDGYTRITVHHSADPSPVDLDGSSTKTFEAVREIQKAHMDGKTTQYGDIGYHFVIDPYGRVMQGRDLAYQGAHAGGDNNVQNIGICLIGNFDVDQPTAAALGALQKQIEELRAKYNIPKSHVFGHREMRATDCPGKNLMKWVEEYRGFDAAPSARASGGEKKSDKTTAAKKSAKAPPVHVLH